MNRVGSIISTKKDIAIVKLRQHTACGDCGACQLGEENLDMEIEALNKIGAKDGDVVEINLDSTDVLSAAFIMYVIPLITLVAGMFIGRFVFLNTMNLESYEILSLITGIVIMALTFFFIKKNEDKFHKSKKYLSEIVKVVDNSGNYHIK